MREIKEKRESGRGAAGSGPRAELAGDK